MVFIGFFTNTEHQNDLTMSKSSPNCNIVSCNIVSCNTVSVCFF